MRKPISRREFFAFLAAGGIVTATGFWLPGQKLISIPKQSEVYPLSGSQILAWQQEYLNQLRSTMVFNMTMRPETLRSQHP